jgi:glycosyltransferase involved in cell wall biosynthesis
MADRTTILYLITATNAGGTEKALWELVRRLDTGRYSAHVCSLKKPGAFAPRLAAAADGFYDLGLSEAGGPAAALSFIPGFLRLLALARRLRPAIIHAFLFRANLYGRLAAPLAGAPAVISSLRVTEAAGLAHFIDRLTGPMVDMYTAVSEAVRQEAIGRSGIAPEKIVTIPNGIDCSAFPEAAARPPNPNYFAAALPGRLHRQKGHGVLLRALSLVASERPRIEVFFFGQGPDEQGLKQMAADLGLAGRVHFMGLFADPSEALRGMDAVVLPSLWEGMPNVLLEAMAMGLPVIASRLPGIEELVLDGRTGRLCPPADAGALARALLELARDPDRGRALGRAGRRRAEEQFSMDAVVAANAALYDRLTGAAGT